PGHDTENQGSNGPEADRMLPQGIRQGRAESACGPQGEANHNPSISDMQNPQQRLCGRTPARPACQAQSVENGCHQGGPADEGALSPCGVQHQQQRNSNQSHTIKPGKAPGHSSISSLSPQPVGTEGRSNATRNQGH